MNLTEWFIVNQSTIKSAIFAAVIIVLIFGVFKSFGKLLKFGFKVLIVAAAIVAAVLIFRHFAPPV